MSPETVNKDLVLVLMSLALIVGALLNLKNLKTYFLCALIVMTPIYSTEFMPRETFGILGLNLWNIVWLISLALIARVSLALPGAARPPSYFTASLLLFILALLLATVYAMLEVDKFPNIGLRRFTVLTILFGGLLKPIQFLILGWMVYVYGIITRDTSPVIRSIFVSAIVFGFLVLYYYFTGAEHATTEDAYYGTYVAGRSLVSAASGMHANDIGAWATYALVIAVLSREQQRIWVRVRYAAIAMSLLAIVFSFSRTAYVTAPLILLLTQSRIRMKEKLITLGAVAVIIAIFSPLIMERAETGFQEKNISMSKISAGRTDKIWAPLWEDFMERPVVGNGRFAQLRSESFFKNRLTHAHSLYLQILIDMGIIGMFIVFAVIVRLYRIGRKAGTPLPYLVFVLLLVGIPGHSFYPDTTNSLIWIFYGLSLAVLAVSRIEARQKTQSTVSPSRL